MEVTVNTLERLSAMVARYLDNATRDVPIATAESSRVLAAVLAISLGDIDLESRQREVTTLESQVSGVSDALDGLNSFLEEIRSNFSALNSSASEALIQSQELNIEARELLNRSRAALLLANESVLEANRTIIEASELLLELRGRLSEAQNLSAGLDEVIRNVERAENLSLLAEGEADRTAQQVLQVATNVNATVDLLAGVSEMLRETLAVSMVPPLLPPHLQILHLPPFPFPLLSLDLTLLPPPLPPLSSLLPSLLPSPDPPFFSFPSPFSPLSPPFLSFPPSPPFSPHPSLSPGSLYFM